MITRLIVSIEEHSPQYSFSFPIDNLCADEEPSLLSKIISSLKQNLVLEADNLMNDILVNLADNYPQASVLGVTPQMREVITEVNRVEDGHNDYFLPINSKSVPL